MAKELGQFFRRLKKEVLAALEEYWSDYQMLQGHINLICSPVHEAHKEYYEIIEKYVKREYKLGQQEATRLVNKAGVRYAMKTEVINMPIAGIIKRDNDLFGTLPGAEADLLNRTFRASERTMSRVDGQINQIITDGYRSGKGINDIGNQLTPRRGVSSLRCRSPQHPEHPSPASRSPSRSNRDRILQRISYL